MSEEGVGCMQGMHNAAAAEQVEEDLNAYFTAKDNNQDSGAAFLQQYLQHRLWAQDGDDAGVLQYGAERAPVACSLCYFLINWVPKLTCHHVLL